MIWKDYIQGYNNLQEYMKKMYGERGKYMIQSMETHIPIPLNDKFIIVEDVYDMIFGQFIMAERALTSGGGYNESLYSLANSILRPIGDVVFDNTDSKKELAHVEAIMQEKAKDVLTECINFSEKRNKFVKEDFKGVFYKAEDDESEEEDEELDNGEEQTFMLPDSIALLLLAIKSNKQNYARNYKLLQI